jgi:hypothetical protein
MAHELSPANHLQIYELTIKNAGDPAACSVLGVAVATTRMTMSVEAQQGEAYPDVRYVLKWPVNLSQATVEEIIREAGSYFPDDAAYLAQEETTGDINSGMELTDVQAPEGYTHIEVDTPAFDLYWHNGVLTPENPTVTSLNFASRIPSLLMTDWLHNMIGETIEDDLQVPLFVTNNKLQTLFESQLPHQQEPLPL